MRQRYHEDADDDAFDENGLLRDGKSVRTSLFMMDGLSPVQRAVAQSSAARVTDGQGGVAGLHRPGFRIADATALDALDAAYANYERALTTAWRGTASADAAAEQTVDRQVGQDHQQRMDEVYDSYDQQLRDAWRQA